MDLIKSPDWIARGDERFNIVAKAEDPAKTTDQQLLTMLQNLLVERFQMKFHREPTETSGFALVVAKGGAKLTESASDAAGTEPRSGKTAKAKAGPGQPISLKARRYSMAMLVDFLARTADQGRGIDKTGLNGVYDFTLSWDEDAGPSLATALREQLGLRIEPAKIPGEYFVVDSALRPSAN